MGLKALLWAMLAAPAMVLAAGPVAVVTISEGGATVVREATKLQLAEGVRLSAEDLIETTPAARLLRLEFNDGVALDLGPDTRVMLNPRLSGERSRSAGRFYLLQGVAKLTVPKGQPAAAGGFSSPAFDVASIGRSAVFIVLPQEAHAFAESGELALQDRQGGKARTAYGLKNGEFITLQDEAKASVTQRPTASFIQRLPRAFLDTLPQRAELFKARVVEPKPLGDIVYADVQPWIDADGLRAGFVTRWKALAQDTEFRKGLVAGLKAHPEWDRTLFPEKYRPKPASGPGATPPTYNPAPTPAPKP